jgi:hypothetical protein
VAFFDTPRDREGTLRAWQLRPLDRKNVKTKANLLVTYILAQVVKSGELAHESDRARPIEEDGDVERTKLSLCCPDLPYVFFCTYLP